MPFVTQILSGALERAYHIARARENKTAYVYRVTVEHYRDGAVTVQYTATRTESVTAAASEILYAGGDRKMAAGAQSIDLVAIVVTT
jgi:hypothetical protein